MKRITLTLVLLAALLTSCTRVDLYAPMPT